MTGCRFSRRRATRGEEDPPRRVRAGVLRRSGASVGEGRIVKEAAFPCLFSCLPQHENLLYAPRGNFRQAARPARCGVSSASGLRPLGGRPPPHPSDAGSGLGFREGKRASAVVTLPPATKGGVHRPVKRRIRKNPEPFAASALGAVPPEPSTGRCRSTWTARPLSLLEEDGGSGGTVPETSCDALRF